MALNMAGGTIAINGISAGESPAEKEFQERMKERMRQAMGDLMPDDVLRGIVARGIEEAFFKKTTVQRNYHTEEVPAWTVTFIRKECEKQVTEAVNKWVVENQEKFTAIATDAINNGIMHAVIAAFNSLTAQSMHRLRDDLANTIKHLTDRY